MLLVSVVVAAILAAGAAQPQETKTPQRDPKPSLSQDGSSTTAPPQSPAPSKTDPPSQTPSPSGTAPSSQTATPSGTPAGRTPAPAAAQSDLPVSLDHIREGLKKAPDQSSLRITELPADFRVVIL